MKIEIKIHFPTIRLRPRGMVLEWGRRRWVVRWKDEHGYHFPRLEK